MPVLIPLTSITPTKRALLSIEAGLNAAAKKKHRRTTDPITACDAEPTTCDAEPTTCDAEPTTCDAELLTSRTELSATGIERGLESSESMCELYLLVLSSC